MSATIYFKKDKTKVERETIVEEFIQGCKDIYLPNLKMLIKDETIFINQGKQEFIAELDAIFNRVKYQQIKKLIANKSFCNLNFFKEEIISFSSIEGMGQFSLLINFDDGFVRDISIVVYFVG